jgi:exodeoxyribonuclease VII large subunit
MAMAEFGESALNSENGADPDAVKKAYTVSLYNRGVERLLKKHAKSVWVEGVITQLQVRGKAAYLTLGEFAEDDAKPKAVLDVMLWAWQLEDYNARFAQLPTPFALRPDLKVSLLLEPNFYVPTGRFQPKVLDVDEAFTLGELSLTRRKILEKLQKEGLLDKNKKLALAEVPLRIGLITAPGSAAFKDFTTVLLQSGFSFQILLASARMQGAATESTVTEAFAALAKHSLDCICLVRGGGAKTDLVFFDSENICRAIAACPVPVLTGIGHEIDRSLEPDWSACRNPPRVISFWT